MAHPPISELLGTGSDIIIFDPPGIARTGLALAASKSGSLGVIDAEYLDNEAFSSAVRMMVGSDVPFGVRVDPTGEGLLALMSQGVPKGLRSLVVPPKESLPDMVRTGIYDTARTMKLKTLQEVCSVEEAEAAIRCGADGIIARGREGGGRISELPALELMERILGLPRSLPVVVRGGMGPQDIERVLRMGGSGCVLDSQLCSMAESQVPAALQERMRSMEGLTVVTVMEDLGKTTALIVDGPSAKGLQKLVSELKEQNVPGRERYMLVRSHIMEKVGECLAGGQVLYPAGEDIRFGPQFEAYGGLKEALDDISCPKEKGKSIMNEGSISLRAEGRAVATGQGTTVDGRPVPPDYHDGSVAIVGIGTVFPKGIGKDAYWNMILNKVDACTAIPPERWDWRKYYDPDPTKVDKTYSKIGAFITDLKFDPFEFKLMPKMASQIDLFQRYGLIAAKEALKDSGLLDRKDIDRSRVGMVVANSGGGDNRESVAIRIGFPEVYDYFESTEAVKRLPPGSWDQLKREAWKVMDDRVLKLCEDSMPGALANVLAGRIANVFNFTGPNFITDAACASTLAAVHTARNALLLDQIDHAITGGSDSGMAAQGFVEFCKIGALTPDGSRPFDDGANGFLMGEGCGMMVMKRLSDAVRDRDRIYAVIRGVGASSDGKGKGITAPNPAGQVLAMETAIKDAKIDRSTISFIEAHGTSTAVGDFAELNSMGEVFKDLPKVSIGLTSVKSQIGHLKSAAGAAGLIKAALAIHNKVVPPQINLRRPNHYFDWERSPFYIVTEQADWKRIGPDVPRRCSVSSFGFGGTNFNMVLEEYDKAIFDAYAKAKEAAACSPSQNSVTGPASAGPDSTGQAALATFIDLDGWKGYLSKNAEKEAEAFLFSSDNPLDLLTQAEAAAKRAKELTDGGSRLRDAWTMPAYGGRYRLGISVKDADHFIEQVATLKKVGMNEKALMALMNKGIFVGDRERFHHGKVCFMFPGQGSQYINMFRDLKEKYSVVQGTFDRADMVMKDLIPKPLSTFVYQDVEPGTPEFDRASDTLRQTEYNQPSMLTVDTAMYQLLLKLGVRPDVVMGHSLGEYGALIASGIMDFDDALKAVSARGREMRDLKIDDPGKMASIMAGLADVEPVLKGIDGYVIAANKNCYIQTVIAGAAPAVEEAVRKFQEKGVEAQLLPVSHAFHSAIVAPAKDILRAYLAKLTICPPKIPILSNVTADSYPMDGDPAVLKEKVLDLLKEQMASSVEWIGQVRKAHDMGCRTFIEVGPKKALTSFAYNILEEEVKGGRVFPITSNHPKKGGVSTFNEMVANLWAIGFDLRFPSNEDTSFYNKGFIEARSNFEVKAVTPIKEGLSTVPEVKDLGADATDRDVDLSGLGTTTPSRKGARVVISGVAYGLPGRFKDVFSENDLGLLMEGRNLIEPIDHSVQERFVDKHIVRLEKRPDGSAEMVMLDDRSKVAKLAGMLGRFDIVKDFGVPVDVAEDLDITTKLVFAAGLLALKDAGIPLVKRYAQTSTGSFLPEEWELPLELQEDTGVIFASAFPGYDQLIKELDLYYRSKFGDRKEPYVFPRHFMFRVLAMGHSQFAQYIRCKGPNTQMNSACASSTEAIGIAQDWIQTGRCKRVMVLGADVPTSERGMEWFGSSLLALGALTTEGKVEQAAIPFDRRRKGMIMGAGALALVLEAEEEPARRGMNPIAEVLGSHFGNSAFHGARLEIAHIARSMERFITRMEREHSLDRSKLAPDLLFMSHETYTPARGGSSAAEVESLRRTFGDAFRQIIVLNTKGYTGHLFGACVEDPILIRCLEKGLAIPIANLDPANTDPQFEGMQLSRGSTHSRNYGLRLAAGFGSQLSFLLVKRFPGQGRFRSEETYRQWLSSIATTEPVELEVVKNVLRLKDQGRDRLMHHRAVRRGSSEIGFERSSDVQVTDAVIREYTDRVIAVFSERSGLPVDTIDIDADLDSDLGIDSVKQVELFGSIRVHFDLPKDEGVNLKDFPTLRHVIGYVVEKAEKQKAVDARKAPIRTEGIERAPKATSAPPITEARTVNWEQLRDRVLSIVSDKTGYPTEMLDIDLDLEADLGIDTVKQVELFAAARSSFDIPRDDTVNLKDFPTLRHIIDYLAKRSGVASVQALPATASPPAQVVSPPPTAAPSPPSSPLAAKQAPSAGTGPSWDDIRRKVTAIVSEKT
ncbi:MAG: acyltransferase domain-containing protein, partial [Candidatus Thermoplasmatota archaeon]|nr:acyltransferase domain-containing protein [Candidatus Thermoplasmatota archaeon]